MKRLERDAERGLGLVLGGPSTTGKTMIANLLARYVLYQGTMDVRVVTGADVSALDYRKDERMEWWERKIKPAPLLVFDGLGAERDVSFVLDKVDELFAYRGDHGLATLVVTKLSTDKIRERFGVDDGSGIEVRKVSDSKTSVRYASRVADLIENTCVRFDFAGESFLDRQIALSRLESDLGVRRPVNFG
jgi:DNA replication protein DnaC